MDKKPKGFQVGRPKTGGRAAKPKWLKECEQMTAVQFVTSLQNMMNAPVEQINQIAADQTISVKDSIMANWLKASITSNPDRQSLFDRLFGKPTESVKMIESNEQVITLAYTTEDIPALPEPENE